MPSGSSGSSEDTFHSKQPQRQRRSHKKSRQGCANCKFRRVKCDEGKPTCRRCRDYMIPCSDAVADLSSTGERLISTVCPSSDNVSATIWRPRLLVVEPSSDWHHEIILRFCSRTVLTMGSPSTISKYAEVVPCLAMAHEHLLHMIVATTLLHDRALSGLQWATSESYHLGRAAAKFNQKLSETITNDDKDALWATGVYMCATSIFSVGTTNSEEAWPLKTTSDDLKWLRLQAGLRVIWSMADLHRQDGAFTYIGECADENCVFPRLPEPGITGLPTLLVHLCDLDEGSNGSNNPYHTAVRFLSWLLPVNCTSVNILTFMVFAGGMTISYRNLLQERDARALLLLAIWYSRLFNSAWWMVPRAVVECRAIYQYLDQLLIEDPIFQKVLSLVGRACELNLPVSRVSDVGYDSHEDTSMMPLTQLTWVG